MTDPISDDELARLEELAGKATPGPWRKRTNRHPTTDGRDWGWISANTQENVGLPGFRVEWEGELGGANAAYIAALSPPVLRALISRLRRAEELKAADMSEPDLALLINQHKMVASAMAGDPKQQAMMKLHAFTAEVLMRLSAPTRTQAEVVDALERAAKIAEERGE